MPQAERREPRADAARIPADRIVYAVGDCHGRLDLLCELEDKIVRDAETRSTRERIIVYLGDYVDRGPDSAAVIDHLVAGPPQDFQAVHLLGNHEEMLLAFLEGWEERGHLWLANGGEETLRSYGVEATGMARDSGLAELRDTFAGRLPERHRAFLSGLELYHRDGDYLFVHAGLRPGVSLAAQRREDLIWIRDPFLNSPSDFGHVVVHGHTPSARPVERPNRIGIDTGAVFGGPLTALALEGAERRFLQV
jgi:serine/threonine protein phosphatase 1